MNIEISFWIVLSILFYIYAGYSIITYLLAQLIRKKYKTNESFQPSVTIVISAFNEEKVIVEKLNNSIEIDYPQDKLSIVVISDSSDDNTDQLVESFDHPNVQLIKMRDRRGKTHGISNTIPNLKSEIIVFSDANAIYEKNSIQELIKYFSDAKVGYVVGNAQYIQDGQSDAGAQENSYWSMEIKLKLFESRIGSVVGGDGAIYAIRRELFKELRDDDINDFVNPLQIILQGYKGVFNPDAICYEHSADTFEKEIGRKRRIVNRSWRGLINNAGVLNPFKTGIHAWQVFSHKLLRWLGGVFLLLLLVLNLYLYDAGLIYRLLLAGQILVYVLAFIGWIMADKVKKLPFFISMCYYFTRVNIASILGILDNFFGKKYTTWQTIRD